MPNSIINYIKDEWGLEQPDLLLSVSGGATYFTVRADVKKAFKIGLMKTVKSTGAWIISGGLDVGVMGLIGEAVADEMRTNDFVFMGITNWAVFNMRDSKIVSTL